MGECPGDLETCIEETEPEINPPQFCCACAKVEPTMGPIFRKNGLTTLSRLMGQSDKPIFFVEYENKFFMGPLLDIPNKFDFGLKTRESKLPVSFTAGS